MKKTISQEENCLLIVSKSLCKELKVDLIDLAESFNSESVKKAISDAIHFNKWLCSPHMCKACKRGIPHDDQIFDNESIYDYE